MLRMEEIHFVNGSESPWVTGSEPTAGTGHESFGLEFSRQRRLEVRPTLYTTKTAKGKDREGRTKLKTQVNHRQGTG